jgi:hypothetical protein
MRRREFIGTLGGAVAFPLAAHAQTERVRRIGALMAFTENDAEGQARIAAFRRQLQELGLTASCTAPNLAGAKADQVRARCQSQDGQSHRPTHPASDFSSRRRGDRLSRRCLQTLPSTDLDVRF